MKHILTFENENLAYCCGVNEIGQFDIIEATYDPLRPWRYEGHTRKPSWWNASDTASVVETAQRVVFDDNQSEPSSGTGLFVATFNNEQKKEYALACQKFTELYSSPWKKNRNSGNRVKVVVFQSKPKSAVEKPKKSNGILPKL